MERPPPRSTRPDTPVPYTTLFREIEAAAKLKVDIALIDGEAVVLDADGRSNFQSLQNALKASPDAIDYFAFDLLELDGADLTGLPLRERKARLAKILPKTGRRTRFSDHVEGGGEKLLNKFCRSEEPTSELQSLM